MSKFRAGVGVLALLTLTWVAAPALAQQVKPAVDEEEKPSGIQRLEIFNGPERTVHLYGKDLTAEERANLRDLEQADTELAVARARRSMNGPVSPVGYNAVMPGLVYAPPDYLRLWSPADAYTGYLSDLVAVMSASSAVYPPIYPYGLGYPGYPNLRPAPLVVSPQVMNFDAQGNPAVIETREKPAESQPDGVAEARRRRAAALTRVERSQRLRTALNLSRAKVVPVGHDQPADQPAVTVTMKGGKTIEGKLVREDKEWLVVDRANEEVQIRKSEMASIARAKEKKSP